MIVSPLGSGSAGNCHFIEDGSTRILVDCGFGIRETTKRLHAIGRPIESISAIVLTHEHSDHIGGVERVARKHGIPIWSTKGTLEGSRIDTEGIDARAFTNNRSFRIGDLQIQPRRTLHDAADPACFVIESGDGTRIGIATDLGWVDRPVIDHLRGCDALLFESNHDLDMLRDGDYPWSLKRRIMSRNGHLSNDDAMAALRQILDERTRALCLIHLSRKNNHESIVDRMARNLVESLGLAPALHVSRQDEPVAPFEVRRRGSAGTAGAPQMRLFA